MEYSNKLIEKAKQAKSAEELSEFAETGGVKLTEEESVRLFERLNAYGELSDNELDNVSGGGCGSGDVPKFEAGQTVYVRATNAAAKIIENLGKKGDIFPEYMYKIEVHDTGVFTLERWEHELKSSYAGDD